jgi:hypothetical protein
MARAAQHGATPEEVRAAVERGWTIPARYGRQGRALAFDFGQERAERWYEHKLVEVFYVEEADRIVVVTVIAKYGHFDASG